MDDNLSLHTWYEGSMGSFYPGQQPSSVAPSPEEILSLAQTNPEDPGNRISISTAFPYYESLLPHPDIVLRSLPDSTLFYAHRHKLLKYTSTYFAFLILPDQSHPNHPQQQEHGEHEHGNEQGNNLIYMPESANVVNTLLHILYDLPLTPYMPSLPILDETLTALTKYGCALDPLFSPASEITQYLLRRAHGYLSATNSEALAIYTLVAAHGIKSLARSVSAATLSYNLASSMTEEMVIKMGAVYLKRLYVLHAERKSTLKAIMLTAPDGHANTNTCTEEHRKSYFRAYALAAAYVTWHGSSDASISPGWIHDQLVPLLNGVSCNVCKTQISKRINVVVSEWARVRRFI